MSVAVPDVGIERYDGLKAGRQQLQQPQLMRQLLTHNKLGRVATNRSLALHFEQRLVHLFPGL